MGPQELLQINTTWHQGNLEMFDWLSDWLVIYWLIDECWAIRSLRDHSENMSEGKTRMYQFLFSMERVDWIWTENLKKCRCFEEFQTHAAEHPRGLISITCAGCWREMPQRLATYSNCVQKPVPFSSNALKRISPKDGSKELIKMLSNRGKVYQKYKKSLVSTRRYVDVKERIAFVSLKLLIWWLKPWSANICFYQLRWVWRSRYRGRSISRSWFQPWVYR